MSRQDAERQGAGPRATEAVQHQDHDARHESRHRPDREVEPTPGDHEGRADRDDRDESRARDDVEEIGCREKIGIDEDTCDDQHGERDEWRQSSHVDGQSTDWAVGSKGGLAHACPAAIAAALSS
jgi:hypothetical protein